MTTIQSFDESGLQIKSFLMIGQSNMAGRGDISDVDAIKNPLCYMLRMGRWQPMSEPINPDRSIFTSKFRSGISLAASFADEFTKAYSLPVGLIPCADGGTKISEWMPGELLFDHAVMMARLAMRTSTLCGIICHHGESDCTDSDLPEYKNKFLIFAKELRRELGAENLPLIIGEISEDISPKWKLGDNPPKMNTILAELASEIPFCSLVSSHGLTLKNDGVHFDSASCRELGKRYFKKYSELVRGEL